MSWDKWERAAEKGPGAIAWKIGLFTLVLLIVISVAGFVLNPFKQAGRIFNKTIDADNVIYNYEWFKQRHEDILATESKIDSAREAVEQFKSDAGPRDSWHREDRTEHSRLTTVVMGLEQRRADLAAEYNARSRMVNRSIFKTGDVELPESVSVDY